MTDDQFKEFLNSCTDRLVNAVVEMSRAVYSTQDMQTAIFLLTQYPDLTEDQVVTKLSHIEKIHQKVRYLQSALAAYEVNGHLS